DKAQPSFARRFTRRSANSRYFHSSRSHAPNFEIGREVPSYLEFMFRATERDIAHQKCNARDLQNMPSMYNGILQPRISIMTAHKVGEAFPRDPLFRLRGRNVSPGKSLIRNCLVHSIHAHGVVCASATKRVPVSRIL